MLQFPRWRVEVTVDGDVVKTFQEVATTAKAAIGKAKHKMRGAVSNVGPFKFKATRANGDHATKSPRKQAKPMSRNASGLSLTEWTRAAAFAQGHGLGPNDFREAQRDWEADVDPAEWGAPSAKTRQHAVKKSPAQLDREINEMLARKPRGFTPGDPNADDYLRSLDDVNDPPRTDLIRADKDDRARAMESHSRKRASHTMSSAKRGARAHAAKKPASGMHPHAKGQKIMYEVSVGGATEELHSTKAKAIARAKVLADRVGRSAAVFRVVVLPSGVVSYHRPGASTSAIWHSD